jgi:DNA-binding ferritin-like protein
MEQFAILIGTLLQSRTQSQIYHWQAQGVGSDAAHRALGTYYDDIVGLVDTLVESFQGRYGIVRGYKMSSSLREDGNHVMYFEGLCKFVETSRQQITQDSYIQNQIDEIVQLIEHTKYKLINLK